MIAQAASWAPLNALISYFVKFQDPWLTRKCFPGCTYRSRSSRFPKSSMTCRKEIQSFELSQNWSHRSERSKFVEFWKMKINEPSDPVSFRLFVGFHIGQENSLRQPWVGWLGSVQLFRWRTGGIESRYVNFWYLIPQNFDLPASSWPELYERRLEQLSSWRLV